MTQPETRSIRGEQQRIWNQGNAQITGFHYQGETTWGVGVTFRTPDGKHFCGHSWWNLGTVEGGRGRDERILRKARFFLHHNTHNYEACPVCAKYPARKAA